jgi:DMSO reductase family type II enzyme heme b subunit
VRHRSLAILAAVALALASASIGHTATATRETHKPAAGATPEKARESVPAENPLHAADAATRQQALSAAWATFQSTCRPCHGNLGAGDGPFGLSFARRASDLRRPSRDIAGDAVRFTRIRDGAASLGDHAWESSMPAFGDDLDARQIWGLVLLLEDLGKDGSGLALDASGAEIYASRCAVCHGSNGAGDGPLASEIFPPPRDLIRGQYRFRSTEYGTAPIDSDIIGGIARGLGDTAMGRFLPLGAQRLEAVTAHLMTFTPTLFANAPPTLPGSPMPMTPIAPLVARGRAVYDEAHCDECHGKAGRGDGPSAPTLKDESGHPSIATNLTKRSQIKSGGGATTIFRVLSSGMNGTPMGSYATTLSADDRWALAYYLENLAQARPRFSPNVQAGVVTEPIPVDPTASLWKTIPPTQVPLGPQVEILPYWTQPSIDEVDVRVAVNGDQIGILLVWDDRTRDVRTDDAGATSTVPAALARYGAWRLPDRVAVQFPEKPDPKGILPAAYLGDDSRPIRRWVWSADRQERGEPAVVERVAGARQTPTASSEDSAVQTAASFVDGQWRVVLLGKRPAKTAAIIPLAVQSWNGAMGESGHWLGLSGWMSIQLR